MNKPTWDDILADPTLRRLVGKINRRYPYMGEADLLWLVEQFTDANRILFNKAKTAK